MAKNKYSDNAFHYTASIHESGAQPLDSKGFCATKADLIDPRFFTDKYTWEGLINNAAITWYKGLLATVIDDGTLWVLTGDKPFVLKDAPATFDPSLYYFVKSTGFPASPQPTAGKYVSSNYSVVDDNDYSQWTQVITNPALTTNDKYHTPAFTSDGLQIGTAHGTGLNDMHVPYAATDQYGVSKVHSQVTLGTGESPEVFVGDKNNSKVLYIEKTTDGKLVVRVPIDLIDEPIWEDENGVS